MSPKTRQVFLPEPYEDGFVKTGARTKGKFIPELVQKRKNEIAAITLSGNMMTPFQGKNKRSTHYSYQMSSAYSPPNGLSKFLGDQASRYK